MKTKEELDELKEDLETLRAKLQELTSEELEHVIGGYVNLQVLNGTSN